VKCPQKLELGECPQIKFIRQNSKHSLIRKTIKTETTIPSLWTQRLIFYINISTFSTNSPINLSSREVQYKHYKNHCAWYENETFCCLISFWTFEFDFFGWNLFLGETYLDKTLLRGNIETEFIGIILGVFSGERDFLFFSSLLDSIISTIDLALPCFNYLFLDCKWAGLDRFFSFLDLAVKLWRWLIWISIVFLKV